MSVRHVAGWTLVGVAGLGTAFEVSGIPFGEPGLCGLGGGPCPGGIGVNGTYTSSILGMPPWIPLTGMAGGGLWLALGDRHHAPKPEAEKGSARLRSGQLLGRTADRAARRSGRR